MVIKRPDARLSVLAVGATLLGFGFAAGGGALSAESRAAAASPRVEQGQPNGQRSGQPSRGPGSWEWWKDEEVKKELGLSDQKVTRLDNYYQTRNKQLSAIVEEWVARSAELDKMTRERVVDEGTYTLQVTMVESLLSKLRESRTLMLYRMYTELTQDQYKKLLEIRDRRFRRGGHPAQ
jgi:hypothetical protein